MEIDIETSELTVAILAQAPCLAWLISQFTQQCSRKEELVSTRDR